MLYDGPHPELGDGHRRKATPHSLLPFYLGECPQCLEGIRHLDDSTIEFSSPSSAKPKAPLNGRRTFLDGIRVGKRLQLEEDRIIIEELRIQLRSWKEKILKGRNEMLADILTRITAFRTELDEIFSVTEFGEGDYSEQDFVSEDSGCDYEINEYAEKGDGEDGGGVVESYEWIDEEEEYSASEEAEDEEFPSDEQGEETDISSESEEGYGVENKAGIRTDMIHVDTDTDDDQPDTSDSEADIQLLPNRSGEIALECGYIFFDEEDDFNPGLTIEGLAELMKEAHEPGSFHQLSSVKRHIKYAQHTSKDRRTLAQLYLLHHWRRSPASLATHRPTPELFVDASQFGIGLYLGTRWLAWTFRHGHPEIEYGSDGKIDASWAELIAVEIGIFVVLAEGYRCVPISIWSDNMGVVEALKRGTWTANRGLDGISSRILNLCRAHGLSVSPKWIPSKMNPADNASRGAYPPKKMMLSYSPLLPRRLVHFMTKVDLD